MPDTGAASSPQFSTAEFSGKPSTDVCHFCKQSVSTRYYRVNGVMACGSCAERAQRESPTDTHAAFMRGLLFGGAAALLGMIVYATVGIVTGYEIGYVSLAVGFIVGKGVRL